MPSATKPAAQASNQDDLDNYLVGNLSDDPFASPSPESSQKKRKANDGGLGIDEEVNVQKRARAPAVKLDEDRLLGETGIPTLRKRAHNLKIKGKGHEFSDAGRLLSFYQLWLDDLFPKAKFLDALKMVEKAGHKKRVVAARNDWINERNPKATDDANEQDLPSNTAPEPYVDLDVFGVNLPQRPVAGRLVQGSTGAERPSTPQPDDFSDDEELYNATPRARPAGRAPQLTAGAEEPEEDELDALMAEAEGEDRPRAAPSRNNASADDGDDLDALIAEAEDEDGAGASKPKQSTTNGAGQDFDDEEAAMREMGGLW